MGIHVVRSNRGVVIRYFRHAGERPRPRDGRGGKGGGSGGARPGAKTGGSSGTRGDFGADFE
jgi:hypothetical protein